jgi:hypothetical protein
LLKQDKQVSSEGYFKQLKSDYEHVFGSDAGTRVLEDIKRAGFINRTTYSEGNMMFINEGMRSLVLHIIDMARIEVDKTKQSSAEK